jgi:hypothetical protein
MISCYGITDRYTAEGSLQDQIALVNAAVTAFSVVAGSISDSQREDVRGVAFLLYCGEFPYT